MLIKGPTKTVNHSWSDAEQAAKRGQRISSPSWSEGVFVFFQVPSEVPEAIIPKMSSLPSSVKAEFIRRGGPIRYNHQWALVHPDNSIQGWLPLSADIAAEDWIIHHDEDAQIYVAAPVSETAGTAKPM